MRPFSRLNQQNLHLATLEVDQQTLSHGPFALSPQNSSQTSQPDPLAPTPADAVSFPLALHC